MTETEQFYRDVALEKDKFSPGPLEKFMAGVCTCIIKIQNNLSVTTKKPPFLFRVLLTQCSIFS